MHTKLIKRLFFACKICKNTTNINKLSKEEFNYFIKDVETLGDKKLSDLMMDYLKNYQVDHSSKKNFETNNKVLICNECHAREINILNKQDVFIQEETTIKGILLNEVNNMRDKHKSCFSNKDIGIEEFHFNSINGMNDCIGNVKSIGEKVRDLLDELNNL